MKHVFFILTILLSLFSCKDVYEPEGKSKDTIKLSADKLFSPVEGGEFEVTTEGEFWWIRHSMTVDTEIYWMSSDDEGNNCYWFYNDIGFPVEMGKNSTYCDCIIKIEGPWFTVNKVNQQKIIFTVLPNDTGKERTLRIGLLAGNFFTGITLTQSAN